MLARRRPAPERNEGGFDFRPVLFGHKETVPIPDTTNATHTVAQRQTRI